MNRNKRSLDGNNGDDGDQPERKRPALARFFLLLYFPLFFQKVSNFVCVFFFFYCCGSVIVEALKVDSLQKLCSSLEPILRRVVRSLPLLGIIYSAFTCVHYS